MSVSTCKYWVKIYHCVEYADCSITYPNLKEKRKHIDVVSGYTPLTPYKCQKNPAGGVIDRPKSNPEGGTPTFWVILGMCGRNG